MDASLYESLADKNALLEKELAAKNRELEIEAALEKVRARALTMYVSSEINDVVAELYNQYQQLGFENGACCVFLMNHDTRDMLSWVAGFNEKNYPEKTYVKYFNHPVYEAQFNSWEEGKHFDTFLLAGDEKKYYDEYMFNQTDYKNFSRPAKDFMQNFKSVIFSLSYMKYGALQWGPTALTKEQVAITLRFAKVFEQAYTRFLDLQKAEAQSREAKIEAALESVRASSLAMHNSDQLKNVAAVMFKKLMELGSVLDGVFIFLFNETTHNITLWIATTTLSEPGIINIPYSEAISKNQIFKDEWSFFETGEEIFNRKYSGKVKNDFFRYVAAYNDYPQEVKDFHLKAESWIISIVGEKHCAVGFDSWNGQLASPEEFKIIKRFARVFEQAYVRFLDLQKAEAQAREAQIEATLEKIRSRSLAMHASDELREVIAVMFQKTNELNVLMGTIAIWLFNAETKDSVFWVGNDLQQPSRVFLPYDEQLMKEATNYADSWQAFVSGESYINKHYNEAQKNRYFEYVFEHNDLAAIPQEARDFIMQGKGYTASLLVEKNSSLYFDCWSGATYSEESVLVLKRITKVFEQAYVRFLDLQKAEAQAREAEIQLGLERVRARGMAMQSSNELAQLVDIVFKELTKLDLLLDRCIIMIYEPETNNSVWWMANPEQGSPVGLAIPYHNYPPYLAYLDAWQNRTEIWKYLLEGTEKKEWDAFIFSKTEMALLPEEVKYGMRHLESIYLNGSFNNFGSVTAASYQSLPDEQFNILLRFAKVFDLTYTRFNDLKRAEAQARESQIQLVLERVRARTMAMQHSNELAEAAQLLYEQFKSLGIETINSAYTFVHEEIDIQDAWAVLPDGSLLPKLLAFPLTGDDILDARYLSWKKKEPIHHVALDNKENRKHHKFLAGRIAQHISEDIFTQYLKLDTIHFYNANFSEGYLLIITTQLLTKEEENILSRFAKVFEQTYTRFLDLQKAEAQARESQIEAALEKVRSRSLAMHKSDELKDVVAILFKKLKELGLEFDGGAGIHLFKADTKDAEILVAAPGLDTPIVNNLPYDEKEFINNPIINDVWTAKETGKDVFNTYYSFEEKNKYFNYVFKYNDNTIIPDHVREFILRADSYTATFIAEKNSLLGANSWTRQQFSKQDFEILKRFAKVFEQAYIRFLDLQKAEAQARENQIQLALERVRARTMAMQKSDELRDVVAIIYEQLQHLGFTYGALGIVIMDNISGDMDWWMAGFGKENYPEKYHIPYFKHPFYEAQLKAWKEGKKYVVLEVGGNDKKLYDDFIFSQTDFIRIPDEAKQIMRGLEYITFSNANMKHGALSWGTEPVNAEHEQVLQRFAKVFEQTYTRFLDLQKAEAQAREAQIETALERVRSASLSMQKTNQIGDVIFTLYTSLRNLDFALDRSMIIVNHGKDLVHWIAGPEGLLSENGFNVPYIDHSYNNALLTHFEKRTDKWNYLLTGEDKHKLNDHLFNHSDFKLLPEFVQDSMKNFGDVHFTLSSDSYGTLLVSSKDPLSSAQADIISRFSRVFNQAYVRFLDLQKAEAQAREAQIEAALERVRASAMAMHSSANLFSVADVLHNQLSQLGNKELESSIIHFYPENSPDFEIWYSYKDEEGKFIRDHGSIPGDICLWTKEVMRKYYSGEVSYTIKSTDVMLAEWYNILQQRAPDTIEYDAEGKIILPHVMYYHFSKFSAGALLMISNEEPDEEACDLQLRAAKVFELAYRRFKDLEQAEAQAKEAQIEAALERVRSRTLAMQKSDELAETAVVLFKQLINLGIAPNRLYIGVLKDDSGNNEFWVTDEDGSKISTKFTGNIHKNASVKKMYEGWLSKKKSLIIDMQGEELVSYLKYVAEELNIPFKEGLTHTRRVQTIAYFSKGFIGMASPEEQPKETTILLERFAGVLNLTFARFDDLKTAEEHALQAELDLIEIKTARLKAENALNELQLTQKQLIQSEKMASLGELTAGIAHEIQNPLNFVNNFSEVSKELIDEMKAELETGNMQLVTEIANDIIQNLEKINHHGKRADAIVKGMLQHSRKSEGTKEPTDINALCDECLRLSYHGLRAKDKAFNADFKTDFDPTIDKINVVPQEIGRVLLNLFNNAFYATNEKSHQLTTDNYKPLVSIKTKRIDDSVEIKVNDNGIGIPQNIIDKIFQPFFTTKPTGSGTGLGLSLAYDIITKEHNGTIKVESKADEGSSFTIQLPV